MTGTPCAADPLTRADRSAVFTVVETLAPMFNPAQDRCDRCGAEAHMRVLLKSGILLFCGHHGSKHHAALAPIAVDIEVDS